MPSFPTHAEPEQKRSPITPLSVVLGFVFVLFCGILVFVYITTKRINPVMLDQHGARLDLQSQPEQTSPPAAKIQQRAPVAAAH